MENNNNPILSRSARLGVIVLLSIIIVLFIFWRLVPTIFSKETDVEDKKLQAEWQRFKDENLVEQQNSTDDDINYQSIEIKLVPFDPNTASEETLITLGIPSRTAQTIIKYRNKGGVYRKPEDLKKIYTLKPEDFERIAPYIQIGNSNNNYTSNYHNSNNNNYAANKYTEPSSINLNTTSAEELMKLRGIGSAYANRIVNVRDKLGGFINVNQAQQMMNLPDSTFQLIKDKLVVNSSEIKKMNINTATLVQLSAHPYIGKKLAENILLLRNDLKGFSRIEQLRQVPLINEEKYRKIVPYITLN